MPENKINTNDLNVNKVKLTQYSHGAGCGCKISPKVLGEILKTDLPLFQDPNLLVGNESRDDAAVYDLGDGQAVVSTCDFFMPIVDDAFEFGRIAACNAISDIYAMGGRPIMAIAILGWPVDKLPAAVASRVIEGGRDACKAAGISLAGGHSIDAPEPIFGLAVSGTVATERVKQNNKAEVGCKLLLTKPLGIGVLTTAEKQGKLQEQHIGLASEWMCKLNTLGLAFSELDGVKAMTDVTGFGLLGHLTEICEGSDLNAEVKFDQVPYLDSVMDYIEEGSVPGGTHRNFESYGEKISPLTEQQKALLCDPQTSGGLLIAVTKETEAEVIALCAEQGLSVSAIGALKKRENSNQVFVEVLS